MQNNKFTKEALAAVRTSLMQVKSWEPKPENERDLSLKALIKEFHPAIDNAQKKKGYSLEEIVSYINSQLPDEQNAISLTTFRNTLSKVRSEAKNRKSSTKTKDKTKKLQQEPRPDLENFPLKPGFTDLKAQKHAIFGNPKSE